jgi:hypothetical protein
MFPPLRMFSARVLLAATHWPDGLDIEWVLYETSNLDILSSHEVRMLFAFLVAHGLPRADIYDSRSASIRWRD